MQPTHASQPERLEVGPAQQGMRLDRLVADWRGLSRAAVLRLFEAGAVTHNGRTVGRGDKGVTVSLGDRIALDAAFGVGERPRADESLVIDVLTEGAGYVVVDKPAGVAVRPHALDETGTVTNALAASYPGLIGVGEGGLRSGVVHRLDTDTSGALVIAFEQQAWQRLRIAFAEHRVTKRYQALVHGVPSERGEAELLLRVAKHSPAVVEVCDDSPQPDARACSLGWRVLERYGERASLIEVDLHTGFLHQVRITMAHLGHAVIGDAVYGESSPIDAPRQMLHAASLSFEQLEAHAPLPEDFRAVIASLG